MQTHAYTQLKLGDPLALEYLYKRYRRMLYNFGRQWLEDEFVVETLVQDCFLKLWQQRETLESPKHIFFFLRLVMKRECISYFTRPRNKFYRNINRLEYYENYNDYLLKDDISKTQEHLREQEEAQQTFEQVQKVLPLLSAKQQRLIELCLKFGFRYKAMGQMMGSNTAEVYREVQCAIEALKKIIHQGDAFETKAQKDLLIKFQGGITQNQSKVLKLRCEQQLSFAAIAEELGQSPKEVHQAFSIAYQYLQQQHAQPLEPA